MSRVDVVIVAAIIGVALAGCSALPDWMTPDWASSTPSPPPLQPLRFESDPPGADVKTAQGQTCQTPCALAVPSEPQSVTIAKAGFVPQTIQVNVGAPPDHSFWESPPPSLVPNPVQVVLQAAAAPRKPVLKRKPHRSVSRARTAARTAAKSVPPQGGPSNPFPDPQPIQQPAASSPFPPPPPLSPPAQ